ncbi:LOW QUALITY PROTEIN: uncharacterized protein LOC114361878 [Ostrinia furnacalis]|uniref:LOW QUALITY PROTEIN: uncharacterized protein LOC114361878 n=1 Tax=Ostrinia furnacalis TaxID=93504 RepID=UPI00103E8E33|nr:LOW QUALITY PROTEIN: uncharacterized protein LOC114361878 [Ostrinia furnacalis]
MAPPPEYDKEPKAPDKSAVTIANDDSKLLHNIVNDQQTNSDHKPSNTAANTEVENNKQVVNLDDGQLRALLDEAMNYKCPKDLEGKSNLFKELLEEVEQQDDQASEAAARGVARRPGERGGGAGGGRGSGSAAVGGRRRALPSRAHSNSLQDLVAALAAESAPRRPRHHAPAPAPVSTRAIQGGSLPSGVDTSFLLGEEGGGARYLATVRCVNPPPLGERRVSASDANGPDLDPPAARRSKPVFPMTYTARATLEIGSGSVCSGRAVTTTTASNQVRTPRPARPAPPPAPARHTDANPKPNPDQKRLMNALNPKHERNESNPPAEGKTRKPRGPSMKCSPSEDPPQRRATEGYASWDSPRYRQYTSPVSEQWSSGVDRWYEGLAAYHDTFQQMARGAAQQRNKSHIAYKKDGPEVSARTHPPEVTEIQTKYRPNSTNTGPNIPENIATGKSVNEKSKYNINSSRRNTVPILDASSIKYVSKARIAKQVTEESQNKINNVIDESSELYRVEKKASDTAKSDIRYKNEYREKVGYSLKPLKFVANPKNIRNMTIGSASVTNIGEPRQSSDVIQTTSDIKNINVGSNDNNDVIKCESKEEKNVEMNENYNNSDFCNGTESSNNEKEIIKGVKMIEITANKHDNLECNPPLIDKNKDIEMIAIDHTQIKLEKENNNDIELTDFVTTSRHKSDVDSFSQYCVTQEKLLQALENSDANEQCHIEEIQNDEKKTSNSEIVEDLEKSHKEEVIEEPTREIVAEETGPSAESNELVIQLNKPQEKVSNDQYILAELSNNAYVFLTLPKRLLIPLHNKDQQPSLQIHEVLNNTAQANIPDDNTVAKVSNKKKKERVVGVSDDTKRKDAINKTALRVLLFENLKRDVSVKPGASTSAGEEGDSAIPFSCITTPEVVASCNTTSSTPQSAVAVDPKPLQLGSGYRAVASLTGAAPPPAAQQLQVFVPRLALQPRSVISSSFNGLPLSRPCGAAPSDQQVPIFTVHYRLQKSLDENGNAVQGFSSPVSGSGQHKKPRRKKSSKNETVIKSHQIDGYQGNKDLNEVLRFIESHAERPKHDKHKKRSAERRKDKDKPPRASSLEELSRTTLEELTAPAPAPPPEPEPAPPEPEPADFQTVTKRRAKRRPRPPAPGSNDSTDDLESAGSPPAAPPPPAASYADIARTRHNIPDLIESCNFYAEGEAPPPEPPRADDYPALGPRAIVTLSLVQVGERRPAVILLAAGGRARELDGVTFGFDVNETLLAAPARRPRCDLVRDALELDVKTPTAVTAVPAPPTAVPAGGAVPARGVAVGVGSCALRYVAPAPPPDTRVLHQLVDYVGSAWEDVVRCGAGKVRYFSE